MSTFVTIPNTGRVLKATEARIDRIYKSAMLGLKGDSLALASGMTPSEYAQLCEADPAVRMAALQGKAEGERMHAQKLAEASLAGDSKASLAILQHAHGWSAKDQAVAGFGEGGITIVIGDVTNTRNSTLERTIDGERLGPA